MTLLLEACTRQLQAHLEDSKCSKMYQIYLTDADFLTGVGKKTNLMTHVQTVGGEKGSSDTVRDVRGWSIKLYTEEGTQNFVFNEQQPQATS